MLTNSTILLVSAANSTILSIDSFSVSVSAGILHVRTFVQWFGHLSKGLDILGHRNMLCDIDYVLVDFPKYFASFTSRHNMYC